MAPSERDLQNHIWYWVTQWGGFIFTHDSVGIYDPVKQTFRKNTNPSRMAGVADLLGIWKNSPLAIEVKTNSNKLSESQREFRDSWLSHGGIYILAYSLEDVKTALAIDKTQRTPDDFW